MKNMALILTVQPDPEQAAVLQRALGDRVRAEVAVVDSSDAALSAIDRKIPDVLLLHALMLPPEEDYLLAYLRTLPGTAHVQAISIPHLQLQSSCPDDLPRRGLFRGLRQRPAPMAAVGHDPGLFAADVAEYVARARDIKRYIHDRPDDGPLASSDRRRTQRWSPLDIPWVSAVRLTSGERADLINVASAGALVRTPVRPTLLSAKHVDLDSRLQPGLTFRLVSGAEIHALGRIIRCQVGSVETGAMLYDVAFRFDESVGLELPTPAGLAWPCDEAVT
jgi:CheY-like chemotaxis protein